MSKTLILLGTIALSLGLPVAATFAAPATPAPAPATSAAPPGTLDIAALKRNNELAKQENVLIVQANAAIAANRWQDAAAAEEKLIALSPDWDFYQGLGNAKYALNQFQAALDAYAKALAGAAADKTTPAAKLNEARALMLTNKGNAYVHLKQNAKAATAYSEATTFAANPVAAFNLCATLFNMNEMKAALTACDKAIKLDPAKADAYFIKGSILVADATVDASGSMKTPPAALAALRKYLALEPKGAHAGDVKEMLAALAPTTHTKH